LQIGRAVGGAVIHISCGKPAADTPQAASLLRLHWVAQRTSKLHALGQGTACMVTLRFASVSRFYESLHRMPFLRA
jgi:hypothetical protein